jgi:hypothetical protein
MPSTAPITAATAGDGSISQASPGAIRASTNSALTSDFSASVAVRS